MKNGCAGLQKFVDSKNKDSRFVHVYPNRQQAKGFVCRENFSSLTPSWRGLKPSLRSMSEILERIQGLQKDYHFAFPLSESAVQVKIGSQLSECIPQLDQAQVLVDTEPPVGYFDDLPSFNPLFAQGVSTRPCPCGSGQLFQACHGS